MRRLVTAPIRWMRTRISTPMSLASHWMRLQHTRRMCGPAGKSNRGEIAATDEIQCSRSKQLLHGEGSGQNTLLAGVLDDGLDHLTVGLDSIRQWISARNLHHPFVRLIRFSGRRKLDLSQPVDIGPFRFDKCVEKVLA